MAGITERAFKHNRRYAQLGQTLRDAVSDYVQDVREGRFPTAEQAFRMEADERAAFEQF
jgi:3-methyl-2-oxobutanoate hydroxymethyltransferase